MRSPQPNSTSEWFSICSAHRDYNTDCGLCNAGQWIDQSDPYVQIRHWLWEKSPKLWREWANRPDSADGRHIEKLFPKLMPLDTVYKKLIKVKEKLEHPLLTTTIHQSLRDFEMTEKNYLLVDKAKYIAEEILRYLESD